jgi:hypothetical protein
MDMTNISLQRLVSIALGAALAVALIFSLTLMFSSTQPNRAAEIQAIAAE